MWGIARSGFTLRSVCIAGWAGLSLAACTPASQPDELAASDAAPARYEFAQSGHHNIDTTWPTLFRSAELQSLIDEAAASNADLGAAEARIRQAEASARAAGAALLPGLELDSSAQHTLTPTSITSSKPPFQSASASQFNLGLTASYTLDIWGRSRALENAALATAQASVYDRDASAMTITASVANLYIGALASEDRVHIARDNVVAASRILDAIKARLQAGTASALDVAEQESILANQKASVPPLVEAARQQKVQLAILLGRMPEGFTLKAQSLTALTLPEIAAGLPSGLLARRPDVARDDANLEAAEANIAAAHAAYFPTIDLTMHGGVESRMLQNLLRPDAAFSNALASLAAPVFDGGQLRAAYDLEQGRYDELLANYRKTMLTAFGDVETALITVAATRQQEQLQKDAVDAARRAYVISEERLRSGTIDLVTLFTVQQTLFDAEAALVNVRQARFQAAISLIQALGGGFEASHPVKPNRVNSSSRQND